MAQRISLKLSNENDWLIDAIEQERKKQNRPSQNNMIETILVSFFGERGQKNNKTAKRNVKSKDWTPIGYNAKVVNAVATKLTAETHK